MKGLTLIRNCCLGFLGLSLLFAGFHDLHQSVTRSTSRKTTNLKQARIVANGDILRTCIHKVIKPLKDD